MRSSRVPNPAAAVDLVLAGEVVNEVSKLKQQLDGSIIVYGSCQLVHTLMRHDLADELRLMVYPVVLGAGKRLFGDDNHKSMHLLNTRSVGDDLAYLTYDLVRDS